MEGIARCWAKYNVFKIIRENDKSQIHILYCIMYIILTGERRISKRSCLVNM